MYRRGKRFCQLEEETETEAPRQKDVEKMERVKCTREIETETERDCAYTIRYFALRHT